MYYQSVQQQCYVCPEAMILYIYNYCKRITITVISININVNLVLSSLLLLRLVR